MSPIPEVVLDAIPAAIDPFTALRNRLATTPEGGAAMMVVALLLAARDETLGDQCLAAVVDSSRLVEGSRGSAGWQVGVRDRNLIRMQLQRQPYLPRSYVRAATPDNGYRLPPAPYVIDFAFNPYSGDPESGEYKAFIVCSGAASPRPITLRRDEQGLWRAREWSSLLVGVQQPA